LIDLLITITSKVGVACGEAIIIDLVLTNEFETMNWWWHCCLRFYSFHWRDQTSWSWTWCCIHLL